MLFRSLLDAYDAVYAVRKKSQGQVYNIGGGARNAISIWKEFGPLLENFVGHEMQIVHKSWRPGDQKIYISDIRKAMPSATARTISGAFVCEESPKKAVWVT